MALNMHRNFTNIVVHNGLLFGSYGTHFLCQHCDLLTLGLMLDRQVDGQTDRLDAIRKAVS